MAASISVWIAFFGVKVLLLGQCAVSKRVVEAETASLLMMQYTQGEEQAIGMSSSDSEDVDSFDMSRATKGWKACQPHCTAVTDSVDVKCTWQKCQACDFCPQGSSSKSHSHHRSRGGSKSHHRKGGKVEPDNEGPFASEKGPLAMGGDNKNDCPPRYESVETEAECEDAADKIGGILGFHMSEDNPDSPHGCYRQGGGYYLNSADGAPRSGTSKVCKLMKTYCPPDVESYCAKSVCGDEKWDKEHCATTCDQCEVQY